MKTSSAKAKGRRLQQKFMDMTIEFCCFCGEPIEEIEWNSDYEDAIGEGEGT